MSGARIILGPLIGALVRHAIFAAALPWLILNRNAGMEEMGFDSGFPAAGSVLILLGAALYIRAFSERLRMAAMLSADDRSPGPRSAVTGAAEEHTAEQGAPVARSAEKLSTEKTERAVHDDPDGASRPIWSEGVHGRSRNPLQLGVVVILLGESLAFESLVLLIYAMLYWAWLTLYLVIVEEPALRRTLGDEYLRYCRHVPRWFLPFRIRRPA